MLKSALSQGKGSLLGQTGHGKATSWDFSRLFKVFNTQKKWQFATICDLIKHHFVILIKQQPISGRKMRVRQPSAVTYTSLSYASDAPSPRCQFQSEDHMDKYIIQVLHINGQ